MAREPKPAKGEPFRPMAGMQWIWRSALEAEHDGRRYVVEADFFDISEKIHLYVDGRREATMSSPASFEVPGGRIEAAMALYGWKSAVLVSDGEAMRLRPVRGTAERARADLTRRRPRLSALLSAISWTVLVVGVILTGLEMVEVFGPPLGVDFTNPVDLTRGQQGVVTAATVAAGLERALNLRNHWLLDE